MNIIHTLVLAGLMAASAIPATSTPEAGQPLPELAAPAQASIQLAILLDTSGSMGGLIDQARAHLWKIVNELTLARRNGKLPHIEIALYEYGNNDSSSEYMRQVLPLTDDLDALSDALFGLTITGSQEYCGTAISKATSELTWNVTDPNALKMIFIAGNEEFDQGKIRPEDAIREALAKGITVNTIYCGNKDDSISPGWLQGAVRGDGCFASIDHNNVQADPETPYDKDLAKLGSAINGTYVAFGKAEKRKASSDRQARQDTYAGSLGESVVAERAVSKSKENYNNSDWDLVDGLQTDENLSLSKLKSQNMLPEELSGKTDDEIKAFIDGKARERDNIRKQIGELNQKRRDWLDAHRKQDAGKSSLDDAIINAVRKQAESKQFLFEQK